jgi:plastocyanin
MAFSKVRTAAMLASVSLLEVCGVAQAQPAQPTVISVQLSEFRYSPAEIDLDHGQSYILRVTNTGKRAHDLSAKAFFQAVTIAPADAAVVQGGMIEVAPGEMASVTLTTTTAGTYEMHCTHPLHSMLGMSGKIVVR